MDLVSIAVSIDADPGRIPRCRTRAYPAVCQGNADSTSQFDRCSIGLISVRSVVQLYPGP